MRSLGTGMVVTWSLRLFGRLRCLDEGKGVSWDRHDGSLVSQDVQSPEIFETKEKRSLETGMVVPWSPRMFGRLRCLGEGKAVFWGGPQVS